MVPFWTHADHREAEGVASTMATTFVTMGDHSGTHVDAPAHFDSAPDAATVDEVPLERYFTEAICLDLSHKPLRSDITADDLAAAEGATGSAIRPGDTVLLYTGFERHLEGGQGYLTEFPGLVKEAAEWLGRKRIVSFGVEALSPGRPYRNNFLVHQVCRDMGFTHMEGLTNLDKLVGIGRFRFIGFPLRLKGATGSPIRAVAWVDADGVAQ
jgi:kynurenine formamidase